MKKYLNAVVIPCLNEERSLAATCRSLGFGASLNSPPNCILILVDNGSDDDTVPAAMTIQRESSSNSVFVDFESERGYVPPRRRGNTRALSIAAERGVPPESLLVIQADADTLYSDGYVDAISAEAIRAGQGVMIDARSECEPRFYVEHEAYFTLCQEIDSEFSDLLGDASDDVIVDDKACAYWASDYEQWGGHQREYTSRGDELYSETARLYIRGKAFGASRRLCDDAIALHSGRRILAEPALSFATAGFPRENAFKAKWAQVYNGPSNLIDFYRMENRPKIVRTIASRRAHLVGLFQTLTTHVQAALDIAHASPAEMVLERSSLPRRDTVDARKNPGIFLEDVFGLVDRNALTDCQEP